MWEQIEGLGNRQMVWESQMINKLIGDWEREAGALAETQKVWDIES